MTITDPDHVSTAARLREAFGQPRPHPVAGRDTDVTLRNLADYDTAFGVDLTASTGIGIEEAS